MNTRKTLATLFASSLVTRHRNDDSTYICTVDNAPEWIKEAIHSAHGDMLPDDWRYRMISRVADSLTDTAPDDWQECATEIADSCVDVYTGRLTDWLASSISRVGYVDEAVNEYGINEDFDLTKAIMLGQFAEYLEITNSLIASIEEQADEAEAA